MKTMAYLTQYCNLCFEWKSKGITPDNASDDQMQELRELKNNALEQSGLTDNELALICMCRKYGIFGRVNLYAHRIKKAH